MKRQTTWVPLAGNTLAARSGPHRGQEPIASLEEQARRLERTGDRVDPGFLDELATVWDAFAASPGVSESGRNALRQDIVRRLVIRLRVQREAVRRPESMDAGPLERPVFIVGLPRSGTTLLHRLLSDAPGTRAPLLYEMLDPRPAGQDEDRRIARAALVARATHSLAPAMQVMHPLDAQGPEECSFLLPHGLFHHARVRVPEYLDWLENRDCTEDYRFLGQQLRLLEADGTAARWVLKCPSHLWSLDAILSAYPDATVVWTHRSPQVVLPSWCSLTETTMLMHSDHVHRSLLGQDWLQIWSHAVARAMKVRESADPARFIDISYEDLVAAPAQTAARVLAQLGEDHRPAVPHRDPKGSTHTYDLASYGLDPAAIQDAFSDYLTHFHPAEPRVTRIGAAARPPAPVE